MKYIRLVGIFGATLLCWSLPAFAHAGDTKEPPKVNFPLIYFSERMASGGYENLSNSARTSLLEAGNVDRGSYLMEVAVSAGLLSW
jgi:hypothetical protein